MEWEFSTGVDTGLEEGRVGMTKTFHLYRASNPLYGVRAKAQPVAVLEVEPNPAPAPEPEKPDPIIRNQSQPVPQPSPEPSIRGSIDSRLIDGPFRLSIL